MAAEDGKLQNLEEGTDSKGGGVEECEDGAEGLRDGTQQNRGDTGDRCDDREVPQRGTQKSQCGDVREAR